MNATLRVVVVGAAGYSGAEAVAILLDHPGVEIVGLFASERRAGSGQGAPRLDELFPRFRGRTDLEVNAIDLAALIALKPDVVFLATPHEASHDLAPALLEAGAVVIDLSAAFRLRDPSLYDTHYGFTHHYAALLNEAVYGLPEINRAKLAEADLIAAPGCYPTSAILPLHPLAEAGAIARETRPIIDATSGVSGAGRSPALKTHFCEVSLQPYNVLSHRHTPEIAMHAGVPVVFTPHLGAFDRGILSTIHVQLAPGWTGERVRELFSETYGDEPFVRLLPAGQWPSVAAVRGMNSCDLAWAVDEPHHHLIVVSAIDNLVKGAAGQAVQCMNARFDWSETTGLIPGRHGDATWLTQPAGT